MSSKFDEPTFEEIKAPTKSAFSMGPFGSRIKAENFVTEGVPVIKGGNLNGDLDSSSFDFLTPEKAAELSTSIARRLDLVITHRGTLGQVGIIPPNSRYPEYIVSQSQLKLSFDQAKVNPYFIYYFLRSSVGQRRLLANTSQVGVPAIAQALTSIRNIRVPLPSLKEQDSIVDALRLLDDRIALLRASNATLEAIAQAMFKSWFVDFDPVHANAKGRAPEGMSEATAALFPDSFEESELGLVPRGWKVRGISQTCELGRGSSPRPIQKFLGGDVPWIKIADATASEGMFVFETKEMIVKEGVKNSVVVQPGDLIMSNSASCGITVFVELDGCIHDGWLYFKNYQHISKNFLFFWLRKIADHLVHIADGSVQKNLNIALVSSQKILCPSSEVLQSFETIADPLLGRIRENCIQAQTLATLRDTLLPRLISGQLRLPNDESELLEKHNE